MRHEVVDKSVDIVISDCILMAPLSGYTKLFNSILASTIWRAPDRTRLVWITMLAMADKDGVVEGSVPGLADFARVPVEGCRKALAELSAPDEDSRTKDHDGRRIEAVEGVGWRLVNHAKYRAKLSADERREYLRTKQAEYRQRHKQSTNVNKVSDESTMLTQAEADTEADTNTKAGKKERTPPPPKSRSSLVKAETLTDASVPPLDVPLDRWFRELVAAYPAQSVTSGHLTEVAWCDVFMKDLRPAAAVWAEIREGLENQERGHQWRVKSMIPRLDRWLRDGLWKQRHDAHPASTLVNEKTARTLTSGAQFVAGGK